MGLMEPQPRTTFRKALRVTLASLAVVAAVLVAGLGWVRFAPRRVPSGQPPLVTLDSRSLESFRKAFNAEQGKVHILVMLSPT